MPHLTPFPAFRANALPPLEDSINRLLAAEITEFQSSASPFEAEANHCGLPHGDLWFCSYGTALALKFPDTDILRVQFPRRGTATTRTGRRSILLQRDQSCISRGSAEIRFGERYEQLVWRIDNAHVTNMLAAIVGQPVLSDIEFSPSYDLAMPQAQTTLAIMNTLLQTLEHTPPKAAALIVAELEQAMTLALLTSSEHNHRPLFEETPLAAAPWQVHRAEEYIASHWQECFSIDDIVAATGVSARSLFRSFKRFRGYSPWDFVKRIRLDNARQRLESGQSTLSVTEVALSCGWGDISRFSKDFASAYGESPSTLLRRSKGIGGPQV